MIMIHSHHLNHLTLLKIQVRIDVKVPIVPTGNVHETSVVCNDPDQPWDIKLTLEKDAMLSAIKMRVAESSNVAEILGQQGETYLSSTRNSYNSMQ